MPERDKARFIARCRDTADDARGYIVALDDDDDPALDMAPVDAELHAVAVAAFGDAVESSVSLVDRTSFAFMRREGIERAIAVDADFRTAGFETLP